MTAGRLVEPIAAVLLIGAICVDVVGSRCDLPSAAGRVQVSISIAAGGDSRNADRCASGCMPDCYGCSRSEVAGAVQVISRPRTAVGIVVLPVARATDGVLALPYHPPLALL